MEKTNTTNISSAAQRTVLAALLGAVLGVAALPAQADMAENLLSKLRAKGILAEDEYQQMLAETRREQTAAAEKEYQVADKSAKDDFRRKQAESAAAKTTVGGTAFIDFTSINQKTNGTRVPPSGASLDLKRFYLVVNHKFDDMWSANLTTDVNYIANDGQTQVFLKKAYVQANLLDDGALWARLGAADSPWVPFVDDLYSYRYVENSLIDRLKFSNSADWGVHLGGSTFNKQLGYAVSAVNGNGFRNPSRSKSLDYEGRVSFTPLTGLTVAAGFYNGYLGKDVEGAVTRHAAQRWDALVAYVDPKLFRIGFEYFNAKNWRQVLLAPSDESDGYSLWGSVNLSEKLGLFARYDKANLSKDLNPAFKDKYYNLGLSYAFLKNVTGALVYKHEAVDGDALAASNGTIGSNAGARSGRYDEFGIWTQVKF